MKSIPVELVWNSFNELLCLNNGEIINETHIPYASESGEVLGLANRK